MISLIDFILFAQTFVFSFIIYVLFVIMFIFLTEAQLNYCNGLTDPIRSRSSAWEFGTRAAHGGPHPPGTRFHNIIDFQPSSGPGREW